MDFYNLQTYPGYLESPNPDDCAILTFSMSFFI